MVILVSEDSNRYQGRIQDFVLGGTNVGKGSGDRLSSPAGPGQSPVRGPWGKKPPH
jgi:hypothetical protein